MRDSTVTHEHPERRLTRKNLVNSLLIGMFLGVLFGAPIGWFVHQVYARQRAAQVLLCRQQNYGLAEADLQARCGSLY
ncbi:MAG: hypothetical protein MUC48_10160 [Leptolyngbya sp. Prado105]|jgi:hypothetical protein|nr:hypothetical protein [Leptolyngbya sp. Prado105]